jgi:hypothetical protein
MLKTVIKIYKIAFECLKTPTQKRAWIAAQVIMIVMPTWNLVRYWVDVEDELWWMLFPVTVIVPTGICFFLMHEEIRQSVAEQEMLLWLQNDDYEPQSDWHKPTIWTSLYNWTKKKGWA